MANHVCDRRQNTQITAGNRTQSPFLRATVWDIYLIFVLKWTLTFAHFCAILRHCNVKYRFRFLRTTIMIEFSKLLYNLFSDLYKPSFDSFLSFFILFQLFLAALKQVISTIIRTILPNLILPDLILPDLILPELPLFPFFVYYQPTFFAENPSMYFQTQIIAMIYFSQIVGITSIAPVSALHSSISAYLFRSGIPYSHPHISSATTYPIAIRISLLQRHTL